MHIWLFPNRVCQEVCVNSICSSHSMYKLVLEVFTSWASPLRPPFTYCCCGDAHVAESVPEDAPIADMECVESISSTNTNVDCLVSNYRRGHSSFLQGGTPAPNAGAITCAQGIDLNDRIPTSTDNEHAVHRC